MPERIVNLLHDTAYRRTRRSIVGALHRADAAIGRFRGGRLRVLFEAASPMSVSVFAPVYEKLRHDPRLEFWFTSCDSAWQAPAIFTRAGAGDHVITPTAARWMKFDAYVNTDFWDMTWLPRQTRRMHLFHGVAGKYGLDAPTRIAPIVASFDRLLFPNHDRLRRYADAGLIDPASDQAALVGYPKVDCMVNGSLNRGAIERALRLRPSRPTVLYAPTWSPDSSLNRFGIGIVDALSRLDVNVVVKLHDRSYDRATRGSGGIDWENEFEPLCRTRDVRLAKDADASPYLFVADALVTDHSSVGFEFMLLDRPLVVIDSPGLVSSARINPEKVALLRRAAQLAADPEEAANAVARGLARPDVLGEHRRAIARHLFFEPGSAAARAVDCFYGMVGLGAPAAEHAPIATSMPLTATRMGAKTM